MDIYKHIVEIQSLIPMDAVGVIEYPANRRYNEREEQKTDKPEPGSLLRMSLRLGRRELRVLGCSQNGNMRLL
jgi:hypothetical protein